ncbi:MAG TPA: hypothetical protein VK808_01205 [Bacteroidia bacterium]|jgi:hypothetical protein|nr:hypothetical protein [Bacteroidia bacterium]
MNAIKVYSQKLEKKEISQNPKLPEIGPGITKDPKEQPGVKPEEHPIVKPLPNKPNIVPPDVKPGNPVPEVKPVKKQIGFWQVN